MLTPANKKRNIKNGFFVTFEGIDGSGKSVQASALAENLRRMGYAVTLVRDPGGPPVSEVIRTLLLGRRHHRITPIAELFLYEAARSLLVVDTIRPALHRREVVISDRFTDSTVTYQGYGRSIPLNLIRDANRWACEETVPDRTYVLDIPWSESLRRRSASLDTADRMEKEQEDFYRRILEGYRTIGGQEPHRVRIFDGAQSVKILEQEILEDTLTTIDRLRRILKKKQPPKNKV